MGLKGTSGRGEGISILFIASNVTWNGSAKLEWYVSKGFRGPIEWLLSLDGSGRDRIIDPGEEVCRIHIRRSVNAARGVPTKTRNSRCHSGAGCTTPGIQIILVVARKESSRCIRR